ncbi:MAG TPA: hypothetical protein VKA06_00895 [Spirochaetia bacterium]|nr:hypothetical protein [Spirochaetia bacterium]
MPFLTLQDPRAKVKGSRDPLGLVPLWYVPARRLIGNLTTATGSLRGFTLTLLGRWYGERLVREERITEADALPVFLRVEQIGAYVRWLAHKDGDTRGIDRVKRHVDARGTTVPIGTGPDARILSDQKVYGLWGLYSAATRASGLLREGPVGLAPPAREFVEQTYGSHLRALDRHLLPLVEKGGRLNIRRNSKLMAALGEILPNPITADEAAWYGEWIRDGLHVESLPPRRQQRVVDLVLRHTDLDEEIDRTVMERMRDHATNEDPGLARRLQQVLDLEALLVPADLAFEFLQAQDGRTPTEVATALRDRWGGSPPHLHANRLDAVIDTVTGDGNEALRTAIRRTAHGLVRGDYEEAVGGLLAWNDQVMRNRGGAPWIVLGDGGRLSVNWSARERRLPDGDELVTRWHNSYFLQSAQRIAAAVEAAR